jgi:hypothetical protein
MGCKNLNHKLILIIFSQLFLLTNRVVYGQFIPGPRVGHTAVLVRDKIYYIGGYDFNASIPETSDFFYIDTEAWVDLKSQGINLPLKVEHTANIGGVNQDLIFIIGGLLMDKNLVYQFDTKTNVLSTPIIQGKTPNRGFMNSVSYERKIYIFGGQLDELIFGNLDILDTVNLGWKVGSMLYAPPPSSKYTATLVNGVIYYIGGIQQEKDGLGQFYSSMANVCKLIILIYL